MKLAPGLHRIGSDVINVTWLRMPRVSRSTRGLPGHWRELEQELDS